MSEVVEETVHFRILGEDLTRMARDVFLSERPAQAWRILTQHLHGENERELDRIACEVLDGNAKFVTAGNGVDVVPDDDSESYQAEYRYIYAGRIQWQGTWWRPRARITHYGPEDMAYASGRRGTREVPTTSDGRRALTRERADYYRKDTESFLDQYTFDEDDKVIIFEPCGEPPHWWKPLRNGAEALAQWLAEDRMLDDRGPTFETARDEDDLSPEFARGMSYDPERAAERDREEAEKEKKFVELCHDIGTSVREQAGSDTFELTVEDRVFQVPRAPFEHWALDRTALAHMATPWKPISPSGLKMEGDNRYHTDWMLGAGMNLGEDYCDEKIRAAAMDAAFALQEKLDGYEAHVLVAGPDRAIEGTVGKTIAVLPDLGPEHAQIASTAIAIISERGGQLAHLAVVAREREQTIFRVKDALTRFPVGTQLTLYPKNGRIVVLNGREPR